VAAKEVAAAAAPVLVSVLVPALVPVLVSMLVPVPVPAMRLAGSPHLTTAADPLSPLLAV